MDNSIEKSPTKQKIINCAVNMFAMQGYTETSVRDLATAVGLKGASIYAHFPSKNAIMEYILNDYSEHFSAAFMNKDILSILQKNPTTEGILTCMQLAFPKDKEEFYVKVLGVLMQEQHRNPIIRKFMSEQFISYTELNIKMVIEGLIKLNIIHENTDPDYWSKICSSLIYSFASRFLLGNGDNSPDFIGKGMTDLLKNTFDIMFTMHAQTSA